MDKQNLILAIGNIYVETNYLGLNTGGKNILEEGKEYKAEKYEVRLGGSVVNFITQIKKLGLPVGLIGKKGNDEAGEKLIYLLKKEGVSTELLNSSDNVQTSVDTGVVFEHNGNNIQLISGNANQKLSIKNIDFENPVFKSVQAIYLGGSLKQESLFPDYPEILTKFKRKGFLIFLDHGRIPVDLNNKKLNILLESLRLVDGYFPNEQEILGISNKKSVDEALEFISSMGVKLTVVKLGEKGCRIKTQKEDISVPGYKVKAVSTVGAGDSFNAAFVYKLISQGNLKYSGIFANATAAFRVSKNLQPNHVQVEEFLKIN